MSDELTRIAQLEAELDTERHATAPCPPPTDHREAAALGQAYLGLESVKSYLDGVVRGQMPEVAETVFGGLSCKIEEHDTVTRKQLRELRDDVRSMRATVNEIAANLNVVVKSYRLQGARLSELEANCIEHHGAATPSAAPPEANEA